MRTIKFRGYNANNKEWLYGSLLKCSDSYLINPEDSDRIAVDDLIVNTESVGQFTGLHDKNGREIYEGDIISTHLGACEVIHSDYGWAFCTREENKMNTRDKLYYHTFNAWSGYIECGFVIGNIHDNPELMKGGEE